MHLKAKEAIVTSQGIEVTPIYVVDNVENTVINDNGITLTLGINLYANIEAKDLGKDILGKVSESVFFPKEFISQVYTQLISSETFTNKVDIII